MKYSYRIIPYESFDIDGMEQKLGELAEKKGLFLKSSRGVFFKFSKGEPKKVRYRMEGISNIEQEQPEEEELALYEESGWVYTANWQKNFYIFRAEDEASPELYTDPESFAFSLKKVKKRLIRNTVLSTAVTFIALGLIVFFSLAGDFPFLNSVKVGVWRSLWVAILLVCCFVETITAFISYRRLKQKQRGIEKKRKSFGKFCSYFSFCLTMFWAVGWLAIALSGFGWRKTMNLQDYAGKLPVFLLQEIEEAEEDEVSQFVMDGINYASFISVDRDIFVKEMAEVSQHLTKEVLIDGESYFCQIRMYYYDFAFEWMAKAGEKEMFAMMTDGSEAEIVRQTIGEGITYGQINGGSRQLLQIRAGNRLLGISYLGTKDLRDWAQETAGRLR